MKILNDKLKMITRSFFLGEKHQEELIKFFNAIESNERNYDYNLKHTPLNELSDEDVLFIIKYATNNAQYINSKFPDTEISDAYVLCIVQLMTELLYDYEL